MKEENMQIAIELPNDFMAMQSEQRIRIDCVSKANHNLIRLLDKPGGNGDTFIYKQIYYVGDERKEGSEN
jgi:hypothetical protein